MEATDEALLVLVEKVARQLLVAVQRVRSGPEKTAAPQRAIQQAASGKCLACDGENQPENSSLRRGQCDNCYPKTLRRLKSGKLNEASLIKAGKLLPAGVGGRRDSDFPLDSLAEDQTAANTLLNNSKGKTTVHAAVRTKGGKAAKSTAKTT